MAIFIVAKCKQIVYVFQKWPKILSRWPLFVPVLSRKKVRRHKGFSHVRDKRTTFLNFNAKKNKYILYKVKKFLSFCPESYYSLIFYGFHDSFVESSRRLAIVINFVIRKGKSDVMSLKDVRSILGQYHNDQDIYVECPKCGQFMFYYPGPSGLLDGYFKCACSFKVSESYVYDILERENSKMEDEEKQDFKRYLDSDESYYDMSNGDY